MQYNYDNEMNFVFANGLQSKTMTIFLQIMFLSRLAHKISNVEKYILFDEHGKILIVRYTNLGIASHLELIIQDSLEFSLEIISSL